MVREAVMHTKTRKQFRTFKTSIVSCKYTSCKSYASLNLKIGLDRQSNQLAKSPYQCRSSKLQQQLDEQKAGFQVYPWTFNLQMILEPRVSKVSRNNFPLN